MQRAASIALLVVLSAAPLGGAGDPPPAVVRHFDLGNSGGSFAGLADVDQDGLKDLVVATKLGPGVRFATGGGGFGPIHSSPLGFGKSPRATVCDFNGDGLFDVVAQDGLDTGPYVRPLWVALGDGQGNFALSSVQESWQFVSRPMVFDIDGDGLPDAIVATTSGYAVAKNLGGGQLGPVALHGGFSFNAGAVDGDLDGDGDHDVVMFSSVIGSNTLWLLENDGSGSLQFVAGVPYARTWDAALGDVDGDGMLDLATAIDDVQGVEVFRAHPAGLLTSFAGVTPVDVGNPTISVRLGDLDGDGNADLIAGTYVQSVGSGERTVATALSDGSGGFGPPALHAVAGTVPVAAADTDMDGLLDVVGLGGNTSTAGAQQELSVLRGRGDGTLEVPQTIPTDPWLIRLTAADFTGDGREDLLGLESNVSGSRLVLHPNDGAGGLLPALSATAQGAPRLLERAFGDLDGDGDLDVLVSTDMPTFPAASAVFRNDGAGGFTHFGTVSGGYLDVLLADVDGDAVLDALAAADSGVFVNHRGIFVSRGLGNGTFAPAVLALPGTSVHQMAAADFDGDGDLDVATSAADGMVRTFVNTGGVFGGPVVSVIGGAIGDLAAAELDGDGKPDLLAVHGGVQLLRGDGAGGFTAGALAPGLDQAQELHLGDADGDGRVDACGVEGQGFVEWLEADGQGGLDLVARTGGPGATSSATFADLDGDGFREILTGPGKQGWLGRLLPPPPPTWCHLPGGVPGAGGVPAILGSGTLQGGAPASLRVTGAAPSGFTVLLIGASELGIPYLGGTVVPTPTLALFGLTTDPDGDLFLAANWPAGLPSASTFYFQAWIVDAGAPHGWAATPGLRARTP